MSASSASPLSQRIQRIMLDRQQEPVALVELQSLLRRQGKPVNLEQLRALLTDSHTFVALAGEQYILRGEAEEAAETPEQEQSQTTLFLANLPHAQSDYVLLDLETSGLNSDTDQIIQIAALRVRTSRPNEFRSWYVQCQPERLSGSLRAALHLTDDLIAQIAGAPLLESLWPEIRAFLSNDPLVIHNARFDMQFLLRHDRTLTNPVVDTLELALLVEPGARQHTLGVLAQHYALDLDALARDGIPGVPSDYRVSTETLHNAITDALVLHGVYRKLLDRWQQLTRNNDDCVAALLPEACGRTDVGHHALPLDRVDQPVSPQGQSRNGPIPRATELLEHIAEHEGLSPRTSQIEMIQLVEDALNSDQSLLIEAPTGTGKTLGYLIPAVVAAKRQGRRIALATAFKNLQDQLRVEVARVQQHIPFQTQVLKGTSSYLCLRNLQYALDDAGDADFERRYILAFFTRWSNLPQITTLDDLPYWIQRTFPQMGEVQREVVVDRATCTQQRCPFFERCHLFTAYRQGEQADVLLINQALWLAEPSAMPPFDALIIDEAHNLEDMATGAFREEVSEGELRSLLHQLHVPKTRRGALQRILDLKPDTELRAAVHVARRAVSQLLRLIAELRATLATFVVGCDERLEPETGTQLRLTGAPYKIYPTRWQVVQQALDQIWHVYMRELVTALQTIAPLLPPDETVLYLTLGAVRTRLVEQEQLLQIILQARRRDLVSWIEVNTGGHSTGWAFHTAPISVASMLAERYREVRSVVLTSATLTTGPRDFGFFVERLGLNTVLDSTNIHALDGALPYHDNVLLGLPTYLNYAPTQATLQSFVQEFADELSLLSTYTDGRLLTLFTARSRLEAVWNRNHASLEQQGIPVLAQRNGAGKQRLIEQFREHGGAVLYGLKSFWEGIDIPGAALSIVVMEKLPYPALGDPIHEARREQIARQSGREFQDYLFPLMVLQFKQGFGRLLRRHDDQGAVILYDKRVTRKSYLPSLLGALPGFQPRDHMAERSRRRFYTLIADRLPGLIDVEAKTEFLATLPDVLPTDLEALVERLAIPDPLPDSEYDTWRPHILEALKALYGHDNFRSPEQEAALRAMLTGQDVVAVLPTGAGKSLCFQLPALLRRGTTIICSPLIALMRDQIDKLHDRGIEIAAALMSGQSAAEREEVLARVRAGRLRLLYLAPERLRDPVVLAALAAAPIRQIVVDEAHCVALWGPSFRPDFLVLPQVYPLLAERPPVAAFTATATPAIKDAVEDALHLRQPQLVRAPIDRPELRLIILDRHHRYHPIRSKTDQIKRLTLLVQVADARGEAMLIYVATTKDAEYLARLLQVAGYAARAYHGKMPVQERATVGELFMEGLINIVVCTKAFGMGIDKPDIRYVVHFNIPGDLESYAQEAGRAGRDGQTAYAILLYHASDERIQRFFIDQSRPDGALLGNLWNWIAQQPDEWVLDPQATCERFDIDEHALRRAIYLLETAKLLRRGPDVTIRGNLTLLGDWDSVAELVSANHQPILRRVREALPNLAWTPAEIMVDDLALQVKCSRQALEEALINLAVAGGCLYRPWERGYHIVRLAGRGASLPPFDHEVVAAQEQKLEQIHHYVHAPACRWQILRRYFGEDAGQPCGRCDRCDPEQHYPWSGKTGRDVPDVAAFIDLASTLLELVDWNERRTQSGAALYGVGTLIRILRGDEYALMQHVAPGPAADARRQALRACPFWGVCRTLRRSRNELDTLMERLIQEGYIAAHTVPREDGASYQSVVLTEQGRAQLLRGERLGWE